MCHSLGGHDILFLYNNRLETRRGDNEIFDFENALLFLEANGMNEDLDIDENGKNILYILNQV